MELERNRSYESNFKLEFKTAFMNLMDTIDLATCDVGQDELKRMKDCVSGLHESVARRSKARDAGSLLPGREVMFSSGVGQLKLPREEGINVFVQDCSAGYLSHVTELAAESGIRRNRLTDHSFIKKEFEDAARNSEVYKTLKIRLQGLAYGGEAGSFGRIKKLDIAVSARADDVFFLGLVNGVSYQANKMAVYVMSGLPAKNPVEYVDPDHFGFDALRKAYVARMALNYEMVIGRKYEPRLFPRKYFADK